MNGVPVSRFNHFLNKSTISSSDALSSVGDGYITYEKCGVTDMARKEKACGVLAAAGNEKSLTVILLALRDARRAIQSMQASGPEIRVTQAGTMAQVKRHTAAGGVGTPPGILILGMPLRTSDAASAGSGGNAPVAPVNVPIGAGAGAVSGWIEDVLSIAGRNPDMQIVLLAGREIFDHVVYRCNCDNIYVFSLPLRRQTLAEVFRIFLVMYGRSARRDAELDRLRTRVNEMSLVARAKCLLIERERMTEEEAHHYLERRAMDSGLSKREAAEDVIRRYD